MSKNDTAIYVTVLASGQTVLVGLEIMPEPPLKRTRYVKSHKKRSKKQAAASPIGT